MISFRAWCGITALWLGYSWYKSDDDDVAKQHHKVQGWQQQPAQLKSGDKDNFSQVQFTDLNDEELEKQINEIKTGPPAQPAGNRRASRASPSVIVSWETAQDSRTQRSSPKAPPGTMARPSCSRAVWQNVMESAQPSGS